MIIGNCKTREVRIGDQPLDPGPSLELRNHSPDGFAWGYRGSGPAQLALALLLHFTDAGFAAANYQDFKEDVLVGRSDENTLTLQEMTVVDWCMKRGYSW